MHKLLITILFGMVASSSATAFENAGVFQKCVNSPRSITVYLEQQSSEFGSSVKGWGFGGKKAAEKADLLIIELLEQGHKAGVISTGCPKPRPRPRSK